MRRLLASLCALAPLAAGARGVVTDTAADVPFDVACYR